MQILGAAKKRFIFFLAILLILCAGYVLSQNTTKRVFTGSAKINMGTFDDYYLRIVTAEEALRIRPGETIEFYLFVRRGDDTTALHNIEIINDDDVFDLSVEPTSIDELRNIDMVRLSARLSIPPGTETGTYPLKLRVKADEFVEESYPMKTSIEVGDHTNVVRYLLLVLSLGMLTILIYRKKNMKNLK